MTRPNTGDMNKGGAGSRGLGTLAMDPNRTGTDPWREFYGSISLLHDYVIEKCENSVGEDCTPKPKDWRWNAEEEVFSNFVQG